jgi:Uma2 family endonuclease
MPVISYKPRYTIADYLTWQGDWELWDGVAVAMTPAPNFRHQRIGASLVAALKAQLAEEPACGNCHLAYEVDWHVNDHTVVRPDILIVCGPEPDQFVRSPPALIVEILSPSTAEKDRTAKRELYAAQQVPHYIVVDPDTGRLVHFTPDDPRGTEITSPGTFLLTGDCRVTVDPAAILQ